MNAWSLGLTVQALGQKWGSTGRLSRCSEPRASPQGCVVRPDHPREEGTFCLICLCLTTCLRSYKATKVIFLKREEESSRYGLEGTVVTGWPGLEGRGRHRGINREAEGTPQHCPGRCVRMCGVCVHSPSQGCRRNMHSSCTLFPSIQLALNQC